MKKSLVALIVILALMIVPLAAASSSVLSAYGGESTPITQVAGTTESTEAAKSSNGPSTLPFTGADLVVFVAAGLALAGVGVGLRRLGRDKS